MSCSSGLPDLPNFGCGGNIKKVVFIDKRSGRVAHEIEYRKWEKYPSDVLKEIELDYANCERYEEAAEIRDELTLRQLDL